MVAVERPSRSSARVTTASPRVERADRAVKVGARSSAGDAVVNVEAVTADPGSEEV